MNQDEWDRQLEIWRMRKIKPPVKRDLVKNYDGGYSIVVESKAEKV